MPFTGSTPSCWLTSSTTSLAISSSICVMAGRRKTELITMYMLMRLINRRSMPQSKEIAAKLEMSALTVRVRECQIRRLMDRCRDRLLRGELLKLDEDHQIMKSVLTNHSARILKRPYTTITDWKFGR